MPLPVERSLPVSIGLFPLLDMLHHRFVIVSILILSFFAVFHVELNIFTAYHLQSSFCRACHHPIFLMILLQLILHPFGQTLDLVVEPVLAYVFLMLVILDMVQVVIIVVSAHGAVLVPALGFGD
jgi:hypothetical protein